MFRDKEKFSVERGTWNIVAIKLREKREPTMCLEPRAFPGIFPNTHTVGRLYLHRICSPAQEQEAKHIGNHQVVTLNRIGIVLVSAHINPHLVHDNSALSQWFNKNQTSWLQNKYT
jgi:hypothetical protein